MALLRCRVLPLPSWFSLFTLCSWAVVGARAGSCSGMGSLGSRSPGCAILTFPMKPWAYFWLICVDACCECAFGNFPAWGLGFAGKQLGMGGPGFTPGLRPWWGNSYPRWICHPRAAAIPVLMQSEDFEASWGALASADGKWNGNSEKKEFFFLSAVCKMCITTHLLCSASPSLSWFALKPLLNSSRPLLISSEPRFFFCCLPCSQQYSCGMAASSRLSLAPPFFVCWFFPFCVCLHSRWALELSEGNKEELQAGKAAPLGVKCTH